MMIIKQQIVELVKEGRRSEYLDLIYKYKISEIPIEMLVIPDKVKGKERLIMEANFFLLKVDLLDVQADNLLLWLKESQPKDVNSGLIDAILTRYNLLTPEQIRNKEQLRRLKDKERQQLHREQEAEQEENREPVKTGSRYAEVYTQNRYDETLAILGISKEKAIQKGLTEEAFTKLYKQYNADMLAFFKDSSFQQITSEHLCDKFVPFPDEKRLSDLLVRLWVLSIAQHEQQEVEVVGHGKQYIPIVGIEHIQEKGKADNELKWKIVKGKLESGLSDKSTTNVAESRKKEGS